MAHTLMTLFLLFVQFFQNHLTSQMSRLGDCTRWQIMGVMGNDYISDITVVVRVNYTMLKHQLSHRAKLGTPDFRGNRP